MKSFFLYIHKDLSGVNGVWKIGKAMTPYSAVRARQKFCWNKFELDYLFFGDPIDIDALERYLKNKFHSLSSKRLTKNGASTELFQINIDIILKTITRQIELCCLNVKQVLLAEKYSAANSGQCPIGIPSEQYSHYYLNKMLEKEFGSYTKPTYKPALNTFNQLFEYE